MTAVEATPDELNTGSLPVVVRLGMDIDGHRELEWLTEKIARHTAELVAMYSAPEAAVHGKVGSLLRARKTQELDPPAVVTVWRRRCEHLRKLRAELEATEASYAKVMNNAPKQVREDEREVRNYQKLYQSIARLRRDVERLREAVALAEAEARQHEEPMLELASDRGPCTVPRVRVSHLYYLHLRRQRVGRRPRWWQRLCCCCGCAAAGAAQSSPAKGPMDIDVTPRPTAEDPDDIGL